MADIPLNDAMLCWNSGFDGAEPAFEVVRHPDSSRSQNYRMSVGACFSYWRERTTEEQKLQLMIDAWHIAAFYEVPIDLVKKGLLVIPEYRAMLADDCLPKEWQHERA